MDPFRVFSTNNNEPTKPWLKLVFRGIIIFVIIWSIYELSMAIYYVQKTGVVLISSAGSTITVAQQNHRSINVGVGSARIRLLPGTYDLIASNGRSQEIESIQVQRKQIAKITLKPEATTNSQNSQSNITANTFIQLLPFTGANSEFNISYSYNYSGTYSQPTILITTPTAKAQQDALAWIKSVGFNPADLPIKYVTGQVQ